ncbi:hypothetical protein SUGI_0246150 [Cryptomeria japonica]|uniref:uncharacterized protein LOC131047954 n=1 Tax=Cryptomeria japonica TaxID=3369 RepID=UPI002408B6E5|nr:uncharacterized protein LOC131047954 [Cryptomeria japonica]GLJ15061.1 hypothetical protein SUGI_0246150 [Cryptomeria japonica]
MGQSLSAGAFLRRKDPLENSTLSRQASVRTCASYLSSRANDVDSRRILDLDNRFFLNSDFGREDPYGYSSRVYYRSNVNVGEGVPFQWEAQPGKPKTDHEQHGFLNVPLSPPPSFFSSPGEQKMYNKIKKIKSKSRKIHGPCAGCIPFSIKKV